MVRSSLKGWPKKVKLMWSFRIPWSFWICLSRWTKGRKAWECNLLKLHGSRHLVRRVEFGNESISIPHLQGISSWVPNYARVEGDCKFASRLIYTSFPGILLSISFYVPLAAFSSTMCASSGNTPQPTPDHLSSSHKFCTWKVPKYMCSIEFRVDLVD